MPSVADLVAGAGVAIVFLGLVAAAEAWRRFRHPDPESTRKLIHIGGGLVALGLPLVIESHWVVLALALGMAALFLAGKLTGRLRSLHGVSRKSSGTEYYPLVIYLLFYFTHDMRWMYFICVLVLATADALAALIGSRYGRLRYEVDQNYKSVEGSLVFLLVTFLAVFVPLLAWPLEDRPSPTACLLTALLVAMLTTSFEAIAQHGRDNLWVPLGTLIILHRTLTASETELLEQLIVLGLIIAGIGLVAWRSTTFNVGGTLVLILAAYLSWTLTSLDWALPVFLAIAFYIAAAVAMPGHLVIASKPVVKALLLPFVVMLTAYVARWSGDDLTYAALYGPYLAGCLTVSAQSAWDQVLRDYPLRWIARVCGTIATTVIASLVVVLPAFRVQADVALAAPLGVTAAALAVGIPGGLLFDHKLLADSARLWWIARIVSIAAAIGLLALLQAVGVSPLWNPR